MNLFCIPFSGGNSYSYLTFKKNLPVDIRFHTLELPGRGLRVNERLLYSIEEMTNDLFHQIEQNIDDEYVIFGHSLGALLAFTLCQKILEHRKQAPLWLFISGQMAPSLIQPDERYLLPDDQFVDVLRGMAGTPEELLKEKSFLEFFLPIIRADFKAIANYRYQPAIPLEIPISVFMGNEEKISVQDALCWQKETNKEAEVIWFEGGHFYIYNKAVELCSLIKEKCNSVAR
jgi:surfactin synthase thioesterase subunit